MSAVKRELPVLDWRSHAIDECTDHPTGVYKAECGHTLMMVVTLNGEPNGKPGDTCVRKQIDVAKAAIERAAVGLHSPARRLARLPSTP